MATNTEPLQHDALASLRSVLDQVRADAASRERAPDTSETATARWMDELLGAGLGAVTVPRELGGGGMAWRDFFSLLIEVGAADPSIAQSFRTHFVLVTRFVSDLRGGDESAGRWIEEVVAGRLFSGGNGEQGAQHQQGGLRVSTSLEAVEGGYALSGAKFYNTGGVYSHWIAVLSRLPDGAVVYALTPSDAEGVTFRHDWDGFGQRLSASGSVLFDRVQIDADRVLGDPGNWASEHTAPWTSPRANLTTLAQLILTAIIAGIVRAVATDATELVRSRQGRHFPHAPTDVPQDDPVLHQVTGEIHSMAFAAEAVVLHAADALQRVDDARLVGEDARDLAQDAAAAAASAKILVDRLAPRAATRLFDVAGGSATRSDRDLDRHWRNARTLASHNPVDYKTLALGARAVTGRPLPESGFF